MTDNHDPAIENGMITQFKAIFEGYERTSEQVQPFSIIGAMLSLKMSEKAIGEMYKYFEAKGYKRDDIDVILAETGLIGGR